MSESMNQDELISRYVRDRMADDEREGFEMRMLQDPQLAADTESALLLSTQLGALESRAASKSLPAWALVPMAAAALFVVFLLGRWTVEPVVRGGAVAYVELRHMRGDNDIDARFFVSPDDRYVVFRLMVPADSDLIDVRIEQGGRQLKTIESLPKDAAGFATLVTEVNSIPEGPVTFRLQSPENQSAVGYYTVEIVRAD